ncbi:MAG: hypothetical protein WDN48_11330 [Pseudolabrys sp.]
MNRKLAFVAAIVAAFVVTCQTADAKHRRHQDPRLAAVELGVGAAATAGYFAINNWNWKWNNTNGITQLGAIGATTLGCAAVSPMVATVVLNRVLTYREAHILIASCVLPVVGPWLVNQAYDTHPDWEPGAPPVTKPHHKKKK